MYLLKYKILQQVLGILRHKKVCSKQSSKYILEHFATRKQKFNIQKLSCKILKNKKIKMLLKFNTKFIKIKSK